MSSPHLLPPNSVKTRQTPRDILSEQLSKGFPHLFHAAFSKVSAEALYRENRIWHRLVQNVGLILFRSLLCGVCGRFFRYSFDGGAPDFVFLCADRVWLWRIRNGRYLMLNALEYKIFRVCIYDAHTYTRRHVHVYMYVYTHTHTHTHIHTS